MDERQLVQTICAFRLLAPEVELSLSTRESPWFRDRVIPLAINNVSAFSKTQPGATPTIIRSLSSSRRTMAVALKRSPARWLPAACSRYGKTGTAGWDAPRKPHDVQCKRLIFLRACTRDENGGWPARRRFSILPGSAADADQGEPFLPHFRPASPR
jgi:2-iminoacetate synthase